MCLVRSYRSNPSLKQDLAKARFLQTKIFDRGIKSGVVTKRFMPRKQKVKRIFFVKPAGQPEW